MVVVLDSCKWRYAGIGLERVGACTDQARLFTT
jgi:hypothetical protein